MPHPPAFTLVTAPSRGRDVRRRLVSAAVGIAVIGGSAIPFVFSSVR